MGVNEEERLSTSMLSERVRRCLVVIAGEEKSRRCENLTEENWYLQKVQEAVGVVRGHSRLIRSAAERDKGSCGGGGSTRKREEGRHKCNCAPGIRGGIRGDDEAYRADDVKDLGVGF